MPQFLPQTRNFHIRQRFDREKEAIEQRQAEELLGKEREAFFSILETAPLTE